MFDVGCVQVGPEIGRGRCHTRLDERLAHTAVVVTKPVVASAFSPAVCSLFPLSARCVEGCDRLLRNRERRFRDDAGGCYLAELQQRAGLVHRGGTLRCTATTPSLPCAQLSPAGLKTVMLVGVLHAHRFPLTCLQLREKREELNKSIAADEEEKGMPKMAVLEVRVVLNRLAA